MKQSPMDLLQHLDEQLAFLDASCAAFDQGIEFECKRLALHVRVLVHDRGRSSTSLLTHLGAKGRLWFRDPVADKRDRIAKNLAAGGIPLFLGGLITIETSVKSSRYVARSLAAAEADGDRMSRFDDWWLEPALFPAIGTTVTRKDVMHWLAHKDGGGHIDDLPATYVALTREGAMGVRFQLPPSAPPAVNSPIPAAMRQIAEELRSSLRDQHDLIRTLAYEAS